MLCFVNEYRGGAAMKERVFDGVLQSDPRRGPRP